MSSEHTGMLWLPDAMADLGINVVEMVDWETAQGGYFWTDPDDGHQAYTNIPSLFMVHHTAGDRAVPVVQTDSGQWSKANCWIGLWDGHALHQADPDGVPTVVFTSSGPARVSAGYCHWPTALDVFDDIRVPYRQTQPDGDQALNRYAWSAEVVAMGDGSDIHPGVQDIVVQMGALMASRFGWSPWRTIGHLTATTRKIDPYWNGERDAIVTIQDQVEATMDDDACPWNPKCDSHLNLPEWGPESTGVCNVPTWGAEAVAWQVAQGNINVTDNARDDFNRTLTDGRYWVFDHRARA